MDYDFILREVGDFGFFQKLLLFVFTPFIMFYGSMSYWTQIFILLVPEYNCKVSVQNFLNNQTETMTGNMVPGQCGFYDRISKPIQKESFFSPVRDFPSFDFPLFFSENATSVTFPDTGCTEGWSYDFSLLFPSVATQNNWICGDAWKISLAQSAYWIGSMAGYVIAGVILDRFGRWKAILFFNLTLCVAQVGTILVPGFTWFCLLRMFSGMASMPLQSSVYTLSIEFISPSYRKLVGASTAIYWLIMAAVYPWIAFLVRDWKILTLISVFPCLIITPLLRWLPESPCWLLSRNRTEQATEVLKNVAKINGIKKDLTAVLKKALTFLIKDGGKDENCFQTSLSLIGSKNMRKKTLVLFSAWIFICMSYHGVNLSQSSYGSRVYLIYSLGSLLEIPISFIHFLMVDRIGRRLPILVSLAAVAALGPIVSTLLGGSESVWIHFGTSIATRGLFSLAYNVFFQLSCELFPTALRGRGVCFMRTLGDVGTSVAPYLIALKSIDPVLPVLVFSALAFVAGLLTLMLPETLNQPLPQTIEEAEIFGRGQGVCYCPAFSSCKKNDLIQENVTPCIFVLEDKC